MAGLNKAMIIGNIGGNPDVRSLESGAKLAKFTVATNETYKDKDGNRQERTEWHNVILWRGLADVAERYLSKGSKVYIEGRIRTREYEDKDGVKKYFTEIEGDNMVMLDSKGDKDNSASNNYSNTAATNTEKDPFESKANANMDKAPEDDLPF